MQQMKIPNLTCTGLGFRLPAAITLAAPARAESAPEFSKESLNLEHALCRPSRVAASQAMGLTGTMKALVQLAHEQGQLTRDDILDAMPEGFSPDEYLDQIYLRLHTLDIEIVKPGEAEKALAAC